MRQKRFELFSPAVLQLVKTVQAMKSRKMAEYGLKGTNAHCLCAIYDSGEVGLTATELARHCEIDKAQVSRCMAELMEKGLVYRNDIEGRRYKQKYLLTESGAAAAKDIDTTAQTVRDAVRKGISNEEMEAFYRTLDTICANFSAAVKVSEE